MDSTITTPSVNSQTKSRSTFIPAKYRKPFNSVMLTLLAVVVLFLFLLPLAYGVMTSLKTDTQVTTAGAPWYPASPLKFEYNGRAYDIFEVPQADGDTLELALVTRGRESSEFINPENPDAGLIPWEGRWRTLDQVWYLDPVWENYTRAWNAINFPRLLGNTIFYAVFSTLGAVSSAAVVAYGFARYRFPYRSQLFIIVMATIILPPMVTLIPTYAFFVQIGWVGTWLPLIVPQFFANGYNIFLLRQFFMGIPRALDEAAMIDGASHVRIFWSVILPQARPALLAVTLFHFFFAWNDFFGPLIYLAGRPELYPITVGLTAFNGLYEGQENLIQAASMMASVIPLLVFFFAQRSFMQGVVITGVDK